ncbi:Hypothetical predicted protein, partial [Marmota monax]
MAEEGGKAKQRHGRTLCSLKPSPQHGLRQVHDLTAEVTLEPLAASASPGSPAVT